MEIITHHQAHLDSLLDQLSDGDSPFSKDYLRAVFHDDLNETAANPGTTIMVTMAGVVATASCWVSETSPDVGYIGLLRSSMSDICGSESALREAILRAARLLQNRGCKTLYAPVDRSLWFQYRSKDCNMESPVPRRSWEPPYDPALGVLLSDIGFKRSHAFHSTEFETSETSRVLEVLRTSFDESARSGLRIVPASHFDISAIGTMRTLFQMTVEAYRDVPLFEPISFEAFTQLYSATGRLSKLDFSRIMIAPDGSLLGYILAFIDQDSVVVKTLTVSGDAKRLFRKFRTNASSALLYAVLDAAIQYGIQKGVSALVRDTASSRLLEKFQSNIATRIDTYSLWSLSV